MSATRRDAVRGAGALTLATLAAKALGFGGQLALARILLREHVGAFAFSIGIVTLLANLANFEARRDILREAGAPARARVYMLVQGAIALGLAQLLLLLGPQLAAAVTRLGALVATPAEPGFDTGRLMQSMCLLPLIEAIRTPALALFEAKRRFGYLALLECVAALLQVVTSVVLAAAGLGALALVLGFYTGAVLRTLGVLWGDGLAWLGARCTRSDFVSVWRFGGPLLAANLLTAWYWKADDILVGATLGLTAAGLYSLAFETPRALLQLTESLSRVGLALLGEPASDAGALRERQARVFGVAVRASFALLAPPLAIGLLHAETLLRLLFGAKWEPAAPAFQVLLLLVLLRGTFRHWADVASTRGQPQLLTRSCLATSILMPLLIWLLLPLGILGVGLAVLFAWLVPAPFYLRWTAGELGVDLGRIVAPGAAALALSIATGWILVHGLGQGSDVQRCLVMAVQLVVFALVLVRLDRELFDLVRLGLMPRRQAA